MVAMKTSAPAQRCKYSEMIRTLLRESSHNVKAIFILYTAYSAIHRMHGHDGSYKMSLQHYLSLFFCILYMMSASHSKSRE